MGEEGSAESKREREASGGERERKREEQAVGPVTVINWDPCKLSSDLNPAWIQKQVDWCSQIWHGTYIKFKLGFQSSLKNSVPNIFFFFFNGTQ
jgi:hypothetical protein